MGASSRTRISATPALIRFAAAMARGKRGVAARAVAAARRAGATRRAAEETALMLVLHAGFPAALEALQLLNEVWPGHPSGAAETGAAEWRRAGTRLCRRIYGSSYPRLIANVERLHPAIARWMIEQGYGRVLSRGGLAPRARERVAVAVLAAGGWERQLVSHLLGALRLGCERSEIRAAVRTGLAQAPGPARAAARRALHAALGA